MGFILVLAAALGLTALFGSPGLAAASGGTTYTGNDVSYPQCGKSLPSGQAFGIVGVNYGVANTTNPCLATELTWAEGSSGATDQPKAALYVNTANPGNLGVSDWPKNNTDPVTGQQESDPYGACSGGDDQPCAWQYGWNTADLDANRRGVLGPGSYRWWLDVETGNSWETNTANNDADLEGMIAYFSGVGATTGIYSDASQWNQIAGSVATTSPLYSQTDWLAGARTLTGAESNCGATPFTPGGTIAVTQWVPGSGDDGDYACPAAPTAAPVSRFSVNHRRSRLTFTWRAPDHTGITGYNVLSGTRALNRRLIRVRRGPRYTFSTGSGASGPFRLEAVRSNGSVVIIASA